MNETPRRTATKGKVTVALDFRNPRPEGTGSDTGRYSDLGDVLAILTLLQQLGGKECEVFFDFGVISVTNVDLRKIRDRFMASDAKAGGA